MKYLLILFLVLNTGISYAKEQTAIFAGGCFWCMEADFDKLAGVISTTSGYDGGVIPNPDYNLVSNGNSGYSEVVKVVYDDTKLSYTQLVTYFFHHIDPTNPNGQFCDVGEQYKSKIFYLNDTQKNLATQVKSQLKQKVVYTQILPATKFYPAEDYHQKYYKKNTAKYTFYRWNCGRDAKIQEVWNEK